MGRNWFAAARSRMEEALVIPMAIIFALMLVIGLGLMFEDVTTTYYGYSALPTQKANEWTALLVAMVPTIAQMGFAYTYLRDDGNRWAITVAGLLFVFDIATDATYKAGGSSDPLIWALAVVESIAVFTVMSELMVATSFGMLRQMWPELSKQIAGLGLGEMLLFRRGDGESRDGRNGGALRDD